MAEPCDDGRRPTAEEPPTQERMSEWRVLAKKAIEASLELAGEPEAA